ncbi:MAG: PEP-CTERM sorting domain-containing protein [Nostoc sp.]
MLKLSSFALAFAASLIMANTETVRATVLNGGFETGSFSDWITTGQATVEDSSFGVTPTDGNYQSILETLNDSTGVSGSDLETFLELSPGSLGAEEGTAIKQTVNINAGDILTFDWNFLTDQDPDATYNDFAFFSLGNITNQLADTNSPFTIFTSFSRLSKETGYQPYSYKFQIAGTYTLGFGVVDIGDDTVNSALLVDNIQLTKTVTSVPEPSTILATFITLLFGFTRKRQIKKIN